MTNRLHSAPLPRVSRPRAAWRIRRPAVLLILALGLSGGCALQGRRAVEPVAQAPAPAPPCPAPEPAPPPPPPAATTGLEIHSLRLVLTPDEAGRLSLSDHPPLAGAIELDPVLAREGMTPAEAARRSFQVLVHDGRLYLTADHFQAVWELTPLPGESAAALRAIAIPGADPATGLVSPALSRFGGGDAVCVRVDQPGHEPVFITRQGAADAGCS